jgi:hypothetical protein
MMTKSMWACATVLLATAACGGDSGTQLSGETGLEPAQTDKPAGTTGGTTGSTPTSSAGTGGRSSSTPTGMNTGTTTGMTGSPASAGTSASSAGTGASGSGATPAAGSGSAGVGGASADDSDAGVGEEPPLAGSGGTTAAGAGGAGGVSGEGERAGAGGTTTSQAGRGGAAAGAGGASSEGTPQVPSDPTQPGPWPVGVRTVNLPLGAGNTPVEVWYPARPGSESERPKVSYDMTAWLPPEHGIPAAAPKVQIGCDCYRELPPDLEHGPYPVVVYVHGAASFRASAASQVSHWASRGFIVIAADHPGLVLRDTLAGAGGCSGSGIPQDFAHTRDVPALFGALAQQGGIFGFLEDSIDVQRVALAGHGDGAAYAADNGAQPGVKLIMSLSDTSVIPAEGMLAGTFYLSGTQDKIVPYNGVVRAYEATARNVRPTLLAGMTNVGHLGFTDMCWARNSDGQDAVAMARRYNICGGQAINVAEQYFWDCPLSPIAGADNYLDQDTTRALVRKLSTYALEEMVLGQSHAQTWNDLAADASWGELRQTR